MEMRPLAPSFHSWVRKLDGIELYVHTFPAAATDDEILGFCAACVERSRVTTAPFVVVADSRLIDPLRFNAKQRKILADFQVENHAADKLWCRGVALVLNTPLQRGALTALYWVKPPVYDYVIEADLDRAYDWATARLTSSS